MVKGIEAGARIQRQHRAHVLECVRQQQARSGVVLGDAAQEHERVVRRRGGQEVDALDAHGRLNLCLFFLC